MKNVESSGNESNGEVIILPHDMEDLIFPGTERYSGTGKFIKAKQCYLKHHKQMDSTIPNEEDDDKDMRSSFARREKEDEEFKSVRKTYKREPSITIPRHLDMRTWDYTDAIKRISLEDGAIYLYEDVSQWKNGFGNSDKSYKTIERGNQNIRRRKKRTGTETKGILGKEGSWTKGIRRIQDQSPGKKKRTPIGRNIGVPYG